MSYSPPEPMVICGEDTVNVVQQRDITTLDPKLSQLSSDIVPYTGHQLVLKSEDSVEILCPIPVTSRDSKDGHRKVAFRPAPARGTQHSPRMLGAMRNHHLVCRLAPGVHGKI